MRDRNIVVMVLLTLVTFGIYSIYWQVSTKIEMNKLGAKIPTAWLMIIPIVNIWWLYKYSEGVEQVTNNNLSTVMSFVLLFLVGFIGALIIQDAFNKSSSSSPAVANPTDTPAQPQPPIPPTTPQPMV
jgi:hypothetical protein